MVNTNFIPPPNMPTIQTPSKVLANRQTLCFLKVFKKSPIPSLGNPFHRAGAVMENAWALVYVRWGTLSGGIVSRGMPDDHVTCKDIWKGMVLQRWGRETWVNDLYISFSKRAISYRHCKSSTDFRTLILTLQLMESHIQNYYQPIYFHHLHDACAPGKLARGQLPVNHKHHWEVALPTFMETKQCHGGGWCTDKPQVASWRAIYCSWTTE